MQITQIGCIFVQRTKAKAPAQNTMLFQSVKFSLFISNSAAAAMSPTIVGRRAAKIDLT